MSSNMGVAIVRQYQRGVVFRLGRLRSVREPGMRFMIPLSRSWPRRPPKPTDHPTSRP